jgi:hypothetical protein
MAVVLFRGHRDEKLRRSSAVLLEAPSVLDSLLGG